jgi:hypothetical protein
MSTHTYPERHKKFMVARWLPCDCHADIYVRFLQLRTFLTVTYVFYSYVRFIQIKVDQKSLKSESKKMDKKRISFTFSQKSFSRLSSKAFTKIQNGNFLGKSKQNETFQSKMKLVCSQRNLYLALITKGFFCQFSFPKLLPGIF